MDDMNVTLNKTEQKLAKYLAKQRYETARKEGSKNVRKGTMPNEETDLEGIAGEIAFCKLMNVYPDMEPGKKPEDCWLRTGKSVDVKTTKNRHGRLIAARWKGDAVDLYALLIGEFPSYTFAGTATTEQLIRDHNLTCLGNPNKGKVFAMSQEELTKNV